MMMMMMMMMILLLLFLILLLLPLLLFVYLFILIYFKGETESKTKRRTQTSDNLAPKYVTSRRASSEGSNSESVELNSKEYGRLVINHIKCFIKVYLLFSVFRVCFNVYCKHQRYTFLNKHTKRLSQQNRWLCDVLRNTHFTVQENVWLLFRF